MLLGKIIKAICLPLENINDLSAFRFIAMYYTLPETEQRSLEDIEIHFSDNSRSITDIHIKINSSQDLQAKRY